MSIKCPDCGLYSPDSTERCECGRPLRAGLSAVAASTPSTPVAAKRDALTLVLLAAIFALLLVSAVGRLVGTHWEYKIASIPDTTFDKSMADLGSQGWELVFARRASTSSDVTKSEFA